MANLFIDEGETIAFAGDLHCDSVGTDARIDDYQTTLLGKLEDILNKCLDNKVKALFFPGDIFSRVLVPHESVTLLGEAFLQFKKAGIKVFTIVGNHDIARNQQEKLAKSPLQTLFSLEVIEHINLNNPVIINGVTLVTPVNYTETPKQAMASFKYNILLAHMFYNANELIDAGDHNITEQDITDWQYDCAVLGHDHVPYDIKKVGRTDIVRAGSVMRASAHEYNFDRIPCFWILKNPHKYNVKNFKKIDIAAKPFIEIASSSIVNKKEVNKDFQDVLSNLAERLTGTNISNGEDRIISLIKTDDKVSKKVRALLFDYFNEAGIII